MSSLERCVASLAVPAANSSEHRQFRAAQATVRVGSIEHDIKANFNTQSPPLNDASSTCSCKQSFYHRQPIRHVVRRPTVWKLISPSSSPYSIRSQCLLHKFFKPKLRVLITAAKQFDKKENAATTLTKLAYSPTEYKINLILSPNSLQTVIVLKLHQK